MTERGRRPVLALFPSARGIGFAVMDRKRRLVDWGTKGTRGRRKNDEALRAVAALIVMHRPLRIVLEDVRVRGTRRHTRIQELHVAIARYARSHHFHLRTYRRRDVYA